MSYIQIIIVPIDARYNLQTFLTSFQALRTTTTNSTGSGVTVNVNATASNSVTTTTTSNSSTTSILPIIFITNGTTLTGLTTLTTLTGLTGLTSLSSLSNLFGLIFLGRSFDPWRPLADFWILGFKITIFSVP